MRCHGNTPTPLPFPLVIRSPPNRPSARVVKTRLGLKMAPFPIHLLLLEMELLLQFARFRKKERRERTIGLPGINNVETK